jgi:glutaminase
VLDGDPLLFDDARAAEAASTGTLPSPAEIAALVSDAYERFLPRDDGAVAEYIPALARIDPDLFGICVVGVTGRRFAIGDRTVGFSLQSLSKPFVFALVAEVMGTQRVRELLGVDATGLPFDSVMAVELSENRTMNPMVNAGALATTSLAPGSSIAERWEFVRSGLSRFAGRELEMDEDIYRSEQETNLRNQGLAHLLYGYGRLFGDPVTTVDVYTRQCALVVDVEDLAVMGATLADGGRNPVTGEDVVGAGVAKRTLAVMATAGLYERSGDWLYDVGLPGKSGVSGGIVTIAPGKGGLATFSPLIDTAGNSVRGQLASRFLSERMGLNIFASQPEPDTGEPGGE